MKTNISALMGLISETERNIKSKSYMLNSYAFNSSVEELDGRVTIIEDNKENFDLILKGLEEGTHELSRLKAILYQKNNAFKLSDGRSIQEAIVDNANLRELKASYKSLLQLKKSKKRVTEVKNSYFECNELNFDPNEIRSKLEVIEKQIQQTDFEIARLNALEFKI